MRECICYVYDSNLSNHKNILDGPVFIGSNYKALTITGDNSSLRCPVSINQKLLSLKINLC